MRLEAGQVAVVTGAASGIGRGLAEGFLRRGLAVVAADVEATALDQAVSEMAASGRVIGQVTDVRVTRGVSPKLDESAVAAVRTALFKPALLGGKPVSVWVRDFPIQYRLHR